MNQLAVNASPSTQLLILNMQPTMPVAAAQIPSMQQLFEPILHQQPKT